VGEWLPDRELEGVRSTANRYRVSFGVSTGIRHDDCATLYLGGVPLRCI
jgi:hypothetical protein